jgi:carboxypeptidase D
MKERKDTSQGCNHRRFREGWLGCGFGGGGFAMLVLFVVIVSNTVAVAYGHGDNGTLHAVERAGMIGTLSAIDQPTVDKDAVAKMERYFDGLTSDSVDISYANVRLAEDAEYDPALDPKGRLFSFLSRKERGERVSGAWRTSPLEFVTTQQLNSEELHVHLMDYIDRCGNISRLVKIGKSVQGRPIEALEISNTVKKGVQDGKPHVKLVAGIHGDETAGRIVSLGMAEWICENYKSDPRARDIVDKTHLWILPDMNPDGYTLRTRYNANGRDLNRDFPDQFKDNGINSKLDGRQPETQTIMKWTMEYPFVSSLAFHGGDLVVSYPLDGTPDGRSYYMRSADDASFIHLAREYAGNHRVLSTFRQRNFPGGITNGAAWYTIFGGSGDWNYLEQNVFELTIELGMVKTVAKDALEGMFKDNKDAVLAFIRASALEGVHGSVRTPSPKKKKTLEPVKGAEITIRGIDSRVLTRDTGEFNRPLAPGNYTIMIKKKGYKSIKENISVGVDGGGFSKDFILKKL